MTRNLIPNIFSAALLVLIGLASTSAALAQSPADPAQPPTASESANIKAAIKSQTLHAPENLIVGQPLQLEVVVEHSPDTLVVMPHALKNTRWNLLESNQSEVVTEGAITTTLSLNFAIFRPGQARLPSFALRVLAPDGTQKELHTEKVTVLARSAIEPGETPPFAPPRDPVAIWTTDYTVAWVSGFILGGALLGGLAVFAMRRRKLADEIMPVRSAHEVALEKLRTLESGALLEQGEVMMYYVRMSEAIREYLGRRFDFPGTELTTAEINAELTRLKSRWPRGIALEDVKRWLEHCDFVKFSGSAPSTDAARNSLERAFGIVELTRRKSEIVIPQDPPTPDTKQESNQVENPSVETTTDVIASQNEPEASPDIQIDTQDVPENDAETEEESD